MISISQSEISCWARCPRRWLLHYYYGMSVADPPVTSASLLGTRIHAALEGHYGYGLHPELVLREIYADQLAKTPEFEKDLTAELDMALAMVSGYLDWVTETGADAGLTVVATEKDVTVPIPRVPGLSLRARLDQVVRRDRDGALLFLDWKTSVNFERHEMLRLDTQMPFYQLIQRLAAGPDGPLAIGGMITTLRRVKRTAKSQPPYYQRDEFIYNPEEQRSTYARVLQICTEIMQARLALDDLYKRTGGELSEVNAHQRSALRPVPIITDCRWSCPFADLCPMMNDGSDWPGVLMRSGRFVQSGGYAYYAEDLLGTVRDRMAKIT